MISMTRRDAMDLFLATAIGAAAALSPGIASSQSATRSRTLIAYLTRSGNTRVFAGALSRWLGADLFSIRTAQPYPADYEEHVEIARQQRDANSTPALADHVVELSGYDTIFLGFPIWGGALPAPARTFLTTHDVSGKALVPFITHGGYGSGSAPETMVELAPDARHLAPFVIECDQERRQLEQLDSWLSSVSAKL
ncbi:MAG: flavodoxin [Gammaproteobacteria bacterium]